jgi:hypothetical protein
MVVMEGQFGAMPSSKKNFISLKLFGKNTFWKKSFKVF